MRALVYTGPCLLQLEEYPWPQPAPGDCEIRVSMAAICGSDLTAFLGRSSRRKPPVVLGHELVGRAPNGQRVVVDPLFSCGVCRECRQGAENRCQKLRLMGMDDTPGCFADVVCVPQAHVRAIPDDLADEQALLAEPLANIVHMFRLCSPVGQRVGIVGAGPMGATALQLAQLLGANEILVEDISGARVENARAMGATLAVDVASEKGRAAARTFAGPGLDLVVDACGSAEARQEAFDLCRPGGQVVLLGMASGRSEVDFVGSIYREHRVAMSFGYTSADFIQALDLLKGGGVDLTRWTAAFPLEEGQKAFEQTAGLRGSTLKTLLRLEH